jgi:hypothetical protein
LFKAEFDDNFINLLADKIADRAYEKLTERLSIYSDWPPVLSKSDLESYCGIKNNKASELLNDPQHFPVTRELGRPKVAKHLLILWIEQNTEWVKLNAPALYRRLEEYRKMAV